VQSSSLADDGLYFVIKSEIEIDLANLISFNMVYPDKRIVQYPETVDTANVIRSDGSWKSSLVKRRSHFLTKFLLQKVHIKIHVIIGKEKGTLYPTS
jgi:hypothetical protein